MLYNMRVFMATSMSLIGAPRSDLRHPLFFLRSAYYHLYSRQIFAHPNAVIRGIENIHTEGTLFVATEDVGFLNRHDRAYLNIRGSLVTRGMVKIGKGCRFDIGPGSTCILDNCSITGQSTLIIAHRLEIGKGCRISWGCEFLDDDWHHLEYPGRQARPSGITLGRHVWVGSHARIMKGVTIGDNVVIAASAVVTHSFPESNILLAGNPARIIRHDVHWS